MKNHLTVNIGNNPPSIFYWCDADSYDNLKKSIEKRYEIPASCQGIEHQGIILNTETFEELYQKRLQFDIKLDVIIDDSTGNLIDSTLVHTRRNLALTKNSGIRNIKIIDLSRHLYQSCQIIYKDLDINTTVLDLKKRVYAEKRIKESTNRINFIYGKLMILTDNQLLVDLFLDGLLKYTQFSFNIVAITVDDCIFDMFENDDENTTIDIKFREIKISMQGIEVKRQIGYPILYIGSFYLEDIKVWIKDMYQIPIEEQTIGYCDGPIFTNNLSRVWLDRSYQLENVELHLYVHYTDKTELKEIYDQNDIRMMEPIKIVSGNEENIWYYYYRGNNGPSLIMIFFMKPLEFEKIYEGFFSLCKEIKLAIKVDDDETDLLKHLEPLGLSRVGSIVIKCPITGSVFCSIPLSRWDFFVDSEDVCNEIIKKHRELFYTKIWLAYDGNKLGKDTIIESLFIRENEILENIELTLFVLPNKRVKEVCEMHHLVYLKEINVKFLTGQFTIDLFQQENLLTVGDLKRTIYEIKDIAPHLQSLFCYKFSDFQLEGFMEIFSLSTDVRENDFITLNLIVKPAKELQVVIKCAGHLLSETIDLNMKETDTISDIKKEVSKITNHPSSIISILSVENCLWKFGENIVGFDDNDQLWNLKLSENNSIELYAMLQVLVSIKATDSTIHQRSFRITNFKSNRIRNISQVLEKEKKLFGSTPKLVKKPGITLETKLIDIGEELIEFVSQPSSTKCLLS